MFILEIIVNTKIGSFILINWCSLLIKMGFYEKLPYTIDYSDGLNKNGLNNDIVSKCISNYSLIVESKERPLLSHQWEEINNNFEKYNLYESLNNFRRNELSIIGTSVASFLAVNKSSSNDINAALNIKKDKNIYLDEFGTKKSYQLAQRVFNYYLRECRGIRHDLLEYINEDYIGGAICIKYKGRRITRNIIKYVHALETITCNIKPSYFNNAVICEIGGGYGGLMKLIKFRFPLSTVILLDVPQTLVLANFYLASSFPEAKVGTIENFIFEDGDISKDKLLKFDIVLLPWWYIEKIERDAINIYTNISSFQEMTKGFIDYYINHIERTLSGYLYFRNRLQAPDHYGGVNFNDYPFDNNWHICYSDESLGMVELIAQRNCQNGQ